ncbi:MAG: inorganic phosphate transporter, partial [Bacteroidales bacterium]|nr:inorganic phosphate transporter [Bacteroidales bacterium]
METIFLILIIVLFGLAISDLIVGVSNDAVNFLNSAIGSKVAPLRVIMIIAALGIVVGATFSSGMMEVARKGIFHPEHFYFSEIIIIFLAVMLTDVILLDTFNTFGMPTSTTVSIVFELLGAAVGISIIKIYSSSDALELGQYINSGKALAIITGILLSIVIAFSVGALVQYITRFLFTFNYKKNLRYYGAIWGGIAITAITYFILIKGAKGASFMSGETKDYIRHN